MSSEERGPPSDYPLAHTEATAMLAMGLDRVQADTGATQRDVAQQLGYKTSVALSHMASGRVPIPVDRALLIANVLELNPAQFTLAVLKQRHPELDLDQLLGVQLPQESALAAELEAVGGARLDDLPPETKQVLRDVVASKRPERRWLSSAELPIVEALRQRYSALRSGGLAPEDRQQLIARLNEE